MRDTKNYISLPYNPALKERAKALRRVGNLSEVLLWNQLKNKQFLLGVNHPTPSGHPSTGGEFDPPPPESGN